MFYFNVLRILENFLAVAERSVANPVRIRISKFEPNVSWINVGNDRSTGYKLQLDGLPNTSKTRHCHANLFHREDSDEKCETSNYTECNRSAC